MTEAAATAIEPAAKLSDDAVADILSQAFAFKHEHEGRLFVVKASGKIIDNPELRRSFAQQVTVMRRDLGLKVIVVHGAGKQIDIALKEAGKVSRKANGLRISEADHIEIIDAATRKANETLCSAFAEAANGHTAPVGLSGHDSNLGMISAPIDADNNNFSGESVLDFNKWYLKSLLDDGKTIPIITNMCSNFKPLNGVTKINVNADGVAAKLAAGMGAHRLLMCSDVPGVLDKEGKIISEIKRDEVEDLIKRDVLSGGMLVKVNEAFTTASRMSEGSAVIIMDEKFLLELLTPKGRGTMFRASALTA